MKVQAVSTVCTLFEGTYHCGVGVLVNSLVRNGFCGRIVAGYRGELPPWCSQLRSGADSAAKSFIINENCDLVFVPVQTDVHLTNYKPRFLLDLCESYISRDDSIFYFDPDIVVRCRWSFFEEWARGGVALCEDVNWRMANDHPIRNAWREYFRSHGIDLPITREAYYNAGFVGVAPEYRVFLAEWDEMLKRSSFDRDMLVGDDRTYLFKGVDQDALNITTMKSGVPLSTIGPDGMDFQPGGGGYVMSHAVGAHKPWNHSYTWAAIVNGRRLSRAARVFMEYADGPIRVFSRPQFLRKTIDRYLAAAVSRFLS